MKTTENGTKAQTPPHSSLILRFWATLYDKTPKLYVLKDFDINFTLVSAFFLFGIRLIGEALFSYWPSGKRRTDAAAAVASIVHAVVLCTSLGVLLWSLQPYSPSGKTSAKDTAATALLQFCTGYMLYDSLGIVRDNWSIGGLNAADCIFLAHHVATAFCMNSCRIVGAGHHSMLMLMFLGEITNPLGSLHSITKYAIQVEGPHTIWHALHPYVEWIFAVTYAITRALIAPAFLLHMTFDLLLRGQKNVPILLSLFWLFLMWGVMLGSLPWTMEAIEMAQDGIRVVKYGVDFEYGTRYEL
jgi:hypothetical protein